MTLRQEHEDSAHRLKGLEKQYRLARQEKEDFHKVSRCASVRGALVILHFPKVEPPLDSRRPSGGSGVWGYSVPVSCSIGLLATRY